jgi:amidophosphoribosyltransferase
MSTLGELFAPAFLNGGPLTPEIEARMAAQLGATSLRYLPVESVARAIGLDADQLCQACITGHYPTPCGRRLAQIATENFQKGVSCRTYETTNGGNGRNGKKGIHRLEAAHVDER